MNYEALASELIRSLRGKRSQTALSRRLGYRTNAVYAWEAGKGFPTAAKTMWLAERVGIDPEQAMAGFYGRAPDWLRDANLCSKLGITLLLDDLRGRAPIQSLARAIGRDRFAVARWFKGQTEPRLPDFLRLIEACSLRLFDFVAAFVSPDSLPEIAGAWHSLQAARKAAYDAPWSHAVLRALELEDYRKLDKHQPGWIAACVGLTLEQEDECLGLLERAQQIRRRGGRWQLRQVSTVDTRHDPRAARKLASWCAAQGATRLERESGGNFAFNLFAISERDLEKLHKLQRDYFNQLRSIVADSKPAERVAVVNMQLFALSDGLSPWTAPE